MARFTPVGVNFLVRGYGTGQRQLQVLNRSIIGLGRAGRISATGVGLMGTAMIAATAAIGSMIGVATASTSAAMDLEDAMTGVLKTTEGLGERFDDLTPLGKQLLGQFRDLSTEIPFTSSELLKIAEIGGQIGIAEEDLLDFTKVIADMVVSTNLGIQDASFAMGRFSTVMGTTREDIRRIGDVIVWLGNTFPATESEIAAFLPRIGAMGKMFRISEADLLGMVGALASLGINAQAGATAIQRTFSRIQLAISEGGSELELLAQVTRMTTEELAQSFEERPMEVFKEFIRGIRDLGDKSTLVLRELQLSTARYLPALQGLAETYDDRFIPAVEGANEAWAENSALADEAGKFYATTRSQIKQTMNVIRKMLEEVGLPLIKWLKDWLIANRPVLVEFAEKLPSVIEEKVIPSIQNISKTIKDVIATATPFAQAIGAGFKDFGTIVAPVLRDIATAAQPLIDGVFKWIQEHNEEVTAALRAIGAAFGALLVIKAVIVIVGLLAAAIGALLSPVVLVVGGIALLAGIIITNWDRIKMAVQMAGAVINATIEQMIDWFIKTIAPIQRVFGNFVTFLGMVVQAIGNAISNVWNWIVTTVQKIVNFIFSIPSKIRDGLLSLINQIGEAIQDAIEFVVNGIQDIVNFVFELPSKFYEAGISIVTSLLDGLKSKWEDVTGWFDDKFQDIKDFLPGSEAKRGPLKGLKKSGAAIIEEIDDGMNSRADLLRNSTLNILQDLSEEWTSKEIVDTFRQAGENMWVSVAQGMARQEPAIINRAIRVLEILHTVFIARGLTALAKEIEIKINRMRQMLQDNLDFMVGNAYTAGYQIGTNLAIGLEVAFPRFQRVIGFYFEWLNALLGALGVTAFSPGGKPKIPGFGTTDDLLNKVADELKKEWIDSIIGGLKDAADDAGDAGDKIKEGGDAVKEAAEEMSKLQFLSEFGDKLASFADSLAEIFKKENIDPLLNRFDEITSEMEKILGGVAEAAHFNIKDINNVISEVLDVIKSGNIQDAYAIIREEQEKVIKLLRNRLGDAWRKTVFRVLNKLPLGDISQDTLETIKHFINLGEIMGRITPQLQEQADIQKEIAEEQEKLLRLEQARAKLDFLREQIDFVEFLREQGLDLKEILGDFKLGLGADIEGLLEIMIKALEKIVGQINEELISQTATSLGTTLNTQVMAPAMAMPMGSRTNNNTFNTTINSDMDAAIFEQRVLRVVQDDIKL